MGYTNTIFMNKTERTRYWSYEILVLSIICIIFIGGCVQEQPDSPQSSCGDGTCQSDETHSLCPEDCPTLCQDECSQRGVKQCDGNGYETCGNYDSDSCLEWSAVTVCTNGKICENGVCVKADSPETGDEDGYAVITKEGDSFYDVAKYFAEKKDAKLVTYKNSFDEVMQKLSGIQPKYIALVISPEELTPDFVDSVDLFMRDTLIMMLHLA